MHHIIISCSEIGTIAKQWEGLKEGKDGPIMLYAVFFRTGDVYFTGMPYAYMLSRLHCQARV